MDDETIALLRWLENSTVIQEVPVASLEFLLFTFKSTLI